MKIINLITLFMIFHCTTGFLNVAKPSANVVDQLFPKGYYAFVKASLNARPPKVRKPPYLPITAECPGLHDINTLFPKNNMCGDLNRGFIPRNPMGQYLHGQPYPFEIIKNKTLQYLSKTLPYLKEEIENVPKVARFVKPSEFFEKHSKRHVRQVNLEEMNQGKVENSTMNVGTLSEKKENSNATKQYRQNSCEGNVICQAIESLKEEGPFSKSFLSNVVSAVGNMASINNVVSLIDQYSQSSNQSQFSPQTTNFNNNRFALSQLLSSVSSIGDSTGSTSSNGVSSVSGSGNGNSYSPLLSIIDYIQSLQMPKYSLKRKTSPDLEDFIPEGSEKPQTPCMSTEEYISPTYARNYQGVWKYVVQIPNEGYFTQTIQQTTCLKNKCDLIDGSCRESQRWVSLLVAEIFYPDIYFPVNQIMPLLYKQQQLIQQQHSVSYKPLNHNANSNSNNNNNNNNRPFPVRISSSTANQMNGLDFNVLNKRNEASNLVKHPALHNLELLARKARTAEAKTNENEPNNDENNVNSTEKKHCDGYDNIGCYVVRVYYDWFLVNGSCKCWKSSSSSINETIKRIFIGKWKKK